MIDERGVQIILVMREEGGQSEGGGDKEYTSIQQSVGELSARIRNWGYTLHAD